MSLEFISIHPKLTHLSVSEIEELIARYYENDKLMVLIEEFKIDVNPNGLLRLFPKVIVDDRCPHCKERMHKKFGSRYYDQKVTVMCPTCKHYADSCYHCVLCYGRVEDNLEYETVETDFTCFEADRPLVQGVVDFDDLTFRDRVFLGAYMQKGIADELTLISYGSLGNLLSPTTEYSVQIIEELCRKGIIFHISSSSSNEDFSNREFFTEYSSIASRQWYLNIESNRLSRDELIDRLVNPVDLFDQSLCLDLWGEIVLYEVIQYLSGELVLIFKVDYEISLKTKIFLKDLSRHYSLSQIFHILRLSINETLRWIVTCDGNPDAALEKVIERAMDYVEQARVSSCEFCGLEIDHTFLESELSKFFFRKVLRIGKSRINLKPQL